MALSSTYTYDIRAMLRRFGVVTVMDVEAYSAELFTADKAAGTSNAAYKAGEWDSISTFNTVAASGGAATAKTPLFRLDTLKIANINQEGPTKTITGGQNADTLLKYGKTLTMEMQEALGKYDVLEAIYGVNYSPNHQIATVTDRFPRELTLVGTTFVVDQKTGAKQPIKIVIPRFLGDGIFNLTQDAEGDATVFDLNGNILRFEGGGAGVEEKVETDFPDDVLPTGVTLSSDEHHGVLYGRGADNEFYFICTEEAYEDIKANGYREAYMNLVQIDATGGSGGGTPTV